MSTSSQTLPAAKKDLVLRLFRATKDESELNRLFEAILTPSEIAALCERALIVEALLAGKTQREISRQTGAGLATIARGSRELKYGSGILHTLFQRLS